MTDNILHKKDIDALISIQNEFYNVLGGAATFSEGFVKCFPIVPRLLGCTAAAMLPKQARGTSRKHITKPSEQVSRPTL